MSKPDQHSKVTLEDLLRLKRAERPSPEFWSNFERELRQKQLTALVHKRRWWHELPVLLNRRVYVPAGAAAIIAFTLVTVRYSVPGRIAQVPNTALRIAAADPAVEMHPSTNMAVVTNSPANRHEDVVANNSDRNPDVVSATGVVSSPSSRPVSHESEVSASRPIVANLSRLEQPEVDSVNSLLGSRLSVPARVEPMVESKSEVAAMTPASTGRYQLIARYADRSLSPAPVAPAVVRERLARRLGDDLGDSISRIGVVGSRVSLKF
jgi:hypothetical protein